jgi:nucleoside-diphosphate-sugar epimerase
VKALVTGGGGFLGRAIVERLLQQGHFVTVLGRRDYPELRALGARCVVADLAEREKLRRAAAGQDVVFHAAAKAGVWGARAEFARANVDGTVNLLAACLMQGVRRFVYTSSPSVVFDGRDHEAPRGELPYPARYEAAYPETKALAEKIALSANDDRIATVALRPHLIYGPRDPHLLPRVIERARAGRLAIVGDGRNKVSVTYVENAAAAHVQAALRLERGCSFSGRAFFVSDAEPVELWPWLNGVLRRLGIPPVTRRVPLLLGRGAGALLEALWSVSRRPGEPPLTRFTASQLARSHWYDNGPARAAFGYEPPVPPPEALDRTIAHFKQHASARAASASVDRVVRHSG